jgi:hypothetical protein
MAASERRSEMVDAHYQCYDRLHEWRQPIYDPVKKINPMKGCPRCGCLYTTWLNYETDFPRKI